MKKGNLEEMTKDELRMMMFRSLIGSILLYAAEIWGWTESQKIEGIQEKYIRWILGLEYNTPAYIVRKEMKTEKMRIEAGIRAQKYEERLRKEGKSKIIKECWNQIKNRKEEKILRWERERELYYKRNGMDLEQVEKAREEKREIGIMLREADVKEQHERIDNSRYNQRYRELYTITKPMYFTAQYEGRDKKLMQDSDAEMKKEKTSTGKTNTTKDAGYVWILSNR